MKFQARWVWLLLLVVVVGCGGESTEAPAEPAEAVEEAAVEAAPIHPDVAQLQADCAAAADAIAARQAEAPLIDRLGGRHGIFAVTTDVVRRHHENEVISAMFEGIDDERLISQVTDFIAQGAGGEQAYAGADMVSAHAHLEITDEHFLAAGGDVQAAMAAAGVGENEIQEVMCMFASLHGEVVNH